MLRAKLSHGRMQSVAMLLFVGITGWAIHHVISAIATGSASDYIYYYWFYLFSFIVLAGTVYLAVKDKPKRKTVAGDPHKVAILVPAYNEDTEVLKDCLNSMLIQSRKPEEIVVVDDGSTAADYGDVKAWFEHETRRSGVVGKWFRTPNGGKRHAQSVAVHASPAATVYVTVDSDSVMDPYALEELLKPLDDTSVQSVAGVILARNNRTNLLARFTDLLFVTGQFIDRSMMSTLGSVLVNSGGLAAYRAEIIRANMDAYLSESFFGKHIEFSDDSMLTLYSLSQGKTVQQPSAFVFTMMPDKMSHHIRQQIRWAKGSFIRSWWRLRYLPVLSVGFMRQMTGWLQFAMTTTIVILLGIVQPVVDRRMVPFMLLVPILVGYGQALRYFSVRRNDETFRSQFLTYLTAPLAVLWAYAVLRPIRLYAMVTCLNTGWGTRKSIEVDLQDKPKLSLRLRLAMTLSTMRKLKPQELTLDHLSVMRSIFAEHGFTDKAETLWSNYLRDLDHSEARRAMAPLHERAHLVPATIDNWYTYYREFYRDGEYKLETLLEAWTNKYHELTAEEKRGVWNDYYRYWYGV